MWCWGASTAAWWMPLGWGLMALFLVGIVALGAWLVATLARNSKA